MTSEIRNEISESTVYSRIDMETKMIAELSPSNRPPIEFARSKQPLIG